MIKIFILSLTLFNSIFAGEIYNKDSQLIIRPEYKPKSYDKEFNKNIAPEILEPFIEEDGLSIIKDAQIFYEDDQSIPVSTLNNALIKHNNLYYYSGEKKEKYLYVLTPEGRLIILPRYLRIEENGLEWIIYHNSMLKGDKKYSACAGEIAIKNGKITFISNRSGHVRSSIYQFSLALEKLFLQGVIDESVEIEAWKIGLKDTLRDIGTNVRQKISSPMIDKDMNLASLLKTAQDIKEKINNNLLDIESFPSEISKPSKIILKKPNEIEMLQNLDEIKAEELFEHMIKYNNESALETIFSVFDKKIYLLKWYNFLYIVKKNCDALLNILLKLDNDTLLQVFNKNSRYPRNLKTHLFNLLESILEHLESTLRPVEERKWDEEIYFRKTVINFHKLGDESSPTFKMASALVKRLGDTKDIDFNGETGEILLKNIFLNIEKGYLLNIDNKFLADAIANIINNKEMRNFDIRDYDILFKFLVKIGFFECFNSYFKDEKETSYLFKNSLDKLINKAIKDISFFDEEKERKEEKYIRLAIYLYGGKFMVYGARRTDEGEILYRDDDDKNIDVFINELNFGWRFSPKKDEEDLDRLKEYYLRSSNIYLKINAIENLLESTDYYYHIGIPQSIENIKKIDINDLIKIYIRILNDDDKEISIRVPDKFGSSTIDCRTRNCLLNHLAHVLTNKNHLLKGDIAEALHMLQVDDQKILKIYIDNIKNKNWNR